MIVARYIRTLLEITGILLKEKKRESISSI